MAITSASKKTKYRATSGGQLRYAITYLAVTTVVLLFLNLYCARVNEQLFRQNKQNALTERANLIAAELADSDSFDSSAALNVALRLDSHFDRILITDKNGQTLYDTAEGDTPPPDFTVSAEPRFSWDYHNGVMTSAVTVPVRNAGTFIGQVYILEVDRSDGQLLKSLRTNVCTITLALEAGLILFSVFYVRRYSRRLRKIMSSMHIIQEGDFSHKIEMSGHDELAFLADEFNYLTERLQTSENKRRQFVSDASHELKTPLASIKLLSDSLLQYDLDADTVREFAGDISNEADRLTRMTNKLLALTKGEGNAVQSDAEIIYMAPTVKRVVKMLRPIALQNNITIHTNLRQDSTVLLQEDDLYQIAFNLVENGIKYNVPGGNLYISLHRQEDMAVLRIRDTGVGIPPDALGHIFERFYRVDKARSRQSGGSGLGLAIVRNMVERNNGDIHLQSTVAMGTTFTVTFPCFDISEEQIDQISSEDTDSAG